MKLAQKENKKRSLNTGLNRPALNEHKKTGIVIFLLIACIASIVFVSNIGKKAEATVKVVMLKQTAAKNQLITEDMLAEYPMLLGEFEKYTMLDNNGQSTKRIVEWDKRFDIVGKAFAAMTIPSETLLDYRTLVTKRTDNSDTVMYSYPGKDIIQLTIGSSDLNAFKTFLQPGDKLNIEAVYSDTVSIEKDDGYGNLVKEDVEVFRTDTVFGNIMIADLINSNGDSILDIYADYNTKDVFTQSKLDASDSFRESVKPASLLVALTPAEKERYYKYSAKNNVSFRVSLPQRMQ